jgi:hypothetical protein
MGGLFCTDGDCGKPEKVLRLRSHHGSQTPQKSLGSKICRLASSSHRLFRQYPLPRPKRIGDRSFRFILLETGRVVESIELVATALRVGCVNTGGSIFNPCEIFPLLLFFSQAVSRVTNP